VVKDNKNSGGSDLSHTPACVPIQSIDYSGLYHGSNRSDTVFVTVKGCHNVTLQGTGNTGTR
jgi:hypothetical protein